MIDNIQISCDIGAIGSSIIIYEDNVACVVQLQMRHIETNYTKLFIQKIIHINYKRVERLVSCKFKYDNYVDSFIKLSWFVTMNLYGVRTRVEIDGNTKVHKGF
jgi:hypothetical protein